MAEPMQSLASTDLKPCLRGWMVSGPWSFLRAKSKSSTEGKKQKTQDREAESRFKKPEPDLLSEDGAYLSYRGGLLAWFKTGCLHAGCKGCAEVSAQGAPKEEEARGGSRVGVQDH